MADDHNPSTPLAEPPEQLVPAAPPPSGPLAIAVSGLRKTYTRRGQEPVEAVAGLDLEVAEGELFGVLGPNGAGKTTTIRILVTLLPPTAGRASVAGHDILAEPQAVRRAIGYVSQSGGLFPGASGRELMQLQGGLQGLSRREIARRIDELSERFGLGELLDRTTGTYSGGQRRLLSLALGMLHRPRVLFLDEPTIGLDPQVRGQLWDEVRALQRDGATVVLTTHYLEEADALCDRIAIIHRGRVVAGGVPHEMKRAVGDDVVALSAAPERLSEAAERLTAQPYVRHLERADGVLRAYVDDGEKSLPLLLMEISDLETTSVQLTSPTLDDVFLRHTGETMQDGGTGG